MEFHGSPSRRSRDGTALALGALRVLRGEPAREY